MQRPPTQAPAYLGVTPLVTTEESDEATVRSLRPRAYAGGATEASAPSTTCVPVAVAQTKAAVYFQTVDERYLREFSADTWFENLMESNFTACITKLSTLKAEAALLGNDDNEMTIVQENMDGATALKVLIRQWRNMAKVKKMTRDKFAGLEPSLTSPCTLR